MNSEKESKNRYQITSIKVRRSKKSFYFVICYLLLVIFFTIAVSSCRKAVSGSVESQNSVSPFASYLDIPGITDEEIAAIETLRKQYSHFVYGVTYTTEAFPVYSEQENENSIYADRTIGGYAARLCEWLTELFNIPFKPTLYDWDTLIWGLEKGSVHFMGDLVATEERLKTHFMTSTISERFLKSFYITDRRPLTEIVKSHPPRLVFTRGFAPFNYVNEITEYVFEPVFANDLAEAYQMLKSGEVDAFLTMNTAEPELDLYGDVVSETFYPLVFASASLSTRNPDLKPIISVLQKALNNGSKHYINRLYSQGQHDYIKNKFLERLTPEEREYLQRNTVVKFVTESDSYPLTFYNRNDNELQGVAIDIIKEIEFMTGLVFDVANNLDIGYLDLIDMVDNGEASMITAMMRSKERESRFRLSEIPFIHDFPVLVSKSDFPNVQFNELENMTVGLVRGTVHAELFKRWFPNNRSFSEYDNLDSVFHALENGEVNMFMSMANILLSIENYKELAGYKANIVFDSNFGINFGFNKNEATLCSIVDKALDLIDLEAITGQWTRKRYDYRIKVAEARLPWLLGATALSFVTLALVMLLFYRNLNLRKLKEAEAKTNEANERAHILFETAPLASCMFDKDLNMFECNHEIVKMLGIPNKEFYLNRFFELSPEYQPCGKLSNEMALNYVHIAYEEGFNCFEWMHKKIDGELLPAEITLVRVKYRDDDVIAGYIRDLTEQKAMEQLTNIVTEKTSILTAILDATPDLIFCKNLNLRYMEINKAMETMFNCHRSDIVGKTDIEAGWGPPDLLVEYNVLDRKIINEKQTVVVEEYLQGFDGRRSLFETIKTPLVQDNKVTGLVGISRDITLRQEMAQLAKQQAEAESANRAKSSFLASMSHEIRTPMNAILGITEIQLQNGKLPSEAKNALNIIYNSGYTLLGIINDLLDLSKIEAGKLELVNSRYETASLINDTINLNMTHIGSKPIEFKLQVDENLPYELIGDELHIKQILNNLLSNAFKYTDSGEVKLSLSAKITGGINASGEYNCNNISANDQCAPYVTLTITVCDTGQGMTEEQVKGMFDAYSRYNIKANRFVEGTGLGMNIVQHLIKKMDGDIAVNSTPGKGTEVTVHLMQGYSGSTILGSKLAESLNGFRFSSISKMKKAQIVREHMPYGKVLVVDDMETNLYVAKGFLLPYGLSIDTALSGKETIEKIERGNTYDIVFMDHMMPVMDGVETAKAIRGKGYTRPIVALTANALAGQAEMFMANGFDGFISKPIDIRELNASLNKFVRDRQPPEVVKAVREAYGIGTATIDEMPKADPEITKIFTKEAEKAIATIESLEARNSYGDDDLQAYTLTVHSLKSTLANIGETTLSVFARDLEQAGREKDIAFITEKNPGFLAELQAVVDRLKSGTEEPGVDDISDEDLAYLRKMLLAIKEACMEYEKKAAKSALAELRQRQWPGAYVELFDAIGEHLLHSEFDEVVSVCENYFSEGGKS